MKETLEVEVDEDARLDVDMAASISTVRKGQREMRG